MERDYSVNEEYEKAKETISYANQIAEQDSGRNESLEGVHFDTYQDVGGDRMYRKMQGGRILDTFTQEEMDKSIESRKEDSFYTFDTSGTDERPSLQPRDERDFVQVLPDDPSSFSNPSNDNFKVETFIAIVNGVAVEKQFLTRDVS